VHGLTRVRGLTMDDAHIFCTKEQMAGELASLLTFVLDLLRDYGLDDFYLELSTRPEGKAVGTDEEWAEATEALRVVAEGMDLETVLDEGGGAFYGPKISVQARDAIGRTWQLSTIQVDFQLPQRFGLTYTGSDNGRHQPVMIHRALFGSIERFFGILTEHYAGAFPTWLAPVQVRVLGVRDDHDAYAFRITDRLRGAASAPTTSTPVSRSVPASARRSWRSCRTCSWWATTTWPTARSGSTPGAPPSSGASRWTTSSTGSTPTWSPTPSDLVGLERLWAGWRSDHLRSVTDQPVAEGEDGCVFCRILASGEPTRTPTSSGAATARSPSSTPSPTPAVTCW
jgi:hypothetical protein